MMESLGGIFHIFEMCSKWFNLLAVKKEKKKDMEEMTWSDLR